MLPIKSLFKVFKLEPDFITLAEKLKSALASAAGIFLLGLALKHFPQFHYPTVMLASMAASAVLLYAAHHSPMAQPWALVGGHFISALCGWWVAQMWADPVTAAAIAVGLSIFMMSLSRCLHPPGAATALIMVLNYNSYRQYGAMWVTHVVFLNALISLFAAILINNFIPSRQYPTRTSRPVPPPLASPIISKSDLEYALAQMDSVIDVSEEDLLTLYKIAHEHRQIDAAHPL